MLGGQFVSRVNLNLREDKGYTYGARTGFNYRRGPGPFTSAGVFTNVTKESVAELLKELRGIRGDIPITENELEYAKQGFLGPREVIQLLHVALLFHFPFSIIIIHCRSLPPQC